MKQERQTLLLAAIFEADVDAIFVIDDQGIVQAVNPAVESLFGYSSSELVGNNVNLLMSSPEHDQHDNGLECHRQSGVGKVIGIGRKITGKRKDGSTFPADLTVCEFRVDNRRHFAGTIRDTSNLRNAEEEIKDLHERLEAAISEKTDQLRDIKAALIKKEKLAILGQVSGGIAHEIRNPLNVLRTSAYYLLNAAGPSEAKWREHLERIDRHVTMIDNIVTALSDIARMPVPNLSVCDIREVIRDLAQGVATEDGITFKNEIEQNLPRVLVDINQIPIVFRNLIRNAREAMPTGGTITVAADATDKYVDIHVIDTGSGIAKEDLEKIVEPLYSTKPRGMGLGLAVSKAIIDRNNGKMDVVSQLGQGTTVTITLPQAELERTRSSS